MNGEFKDIKLADYEGKWVVLFFYPMDFTFVVSACAALGVDFGGTL